MLWQIAPHTEAKHEILREYLKRWLPIIGSWSRGLNYIDGFAGPGSYSGGEDGSPLIAIKAARDHKLRPTGGVFFGFIEQDPTRAKHLSSLLAAQFPAGSLPSGWSYAVADADFDRTVNNMLDGIEHLRSQLAPTLAFVDPFGFAGFPMQTIARLLKSDHCEVFVTLMSGFIARFPEDDRADTLDALFGGPDWRQIRELSGDARTDRILEFYQNGLKRVAQARYVRAFEIRNKKGVVLYHLVFATKHYRGLEEMKESMWAVDRRGLYQFSDVTGAHQHYLLDYDDGKHPHWVDDAAMLAFAHFAGKTVSGRRFHEWIVCESPFIYRAGILQRMNELGMIVGVAGARRSGTYPERCDIQFAPREAFIRGN